MSRASLATRPEHGCCPAAKIRLETFSLCGRWSWRITFRARVPFSSRRDGTEAVERLHISHCPWCGIELPSVRTPVLREVGSDG